MIKIYKLINFLHKHNKFIMSHLPNPAYDGFGNSETHSRWQEEYGNMDSLVKWAKECETHREHVDSKPGPSILTATPAEHEHLKPKSSTWRAIPYSMRSGFVFVLQHETVKASESPIMELQFTFESNALNMILIPSKHSKNLHYELGQSFPQISYPSTRNELEYVGTRLFHLHNCITPTVHDAQPKIKNVYQVINKYYPFPPEMKEIIDQHLTLPITDTCCNLQLKI